MEQRPKSRRETSENRCPKPRRLPPSEPDRHSIARRWRRCPVRIEPQGLPAAPSASGHRALPHRIAAALLILAGLLTANCDSKSEAPRALPRYVVSVASPVRGDLPVYREWVGRLQAQVTAAVLPQVEGYVQERLFTNGQSVKRGDLLYRIDSRRYEQALEQARQKSSQAQADAVAAEQDVGYYAPLVANGAISRQQYTNAQQTAKAARAALQAAEAGVALAETNVAYCTLSSPVDGIMGFAEADVGSYVSPNGRSMVTVSRLDPLRVYFSVSEQEWLRQGGVGGPLSPGQKVEVLLPNDLDPADLERTVILQDPVEAPVTEGQVLGTLELSHDDTVYASVDLLAMHDVEASGLLTFWRDVQLFFAKTSVRIAGAVLLVLLAAVLVWRLVLGRRRYRYGRSVGRGRSGGYRGRRR